MVLFEPKKPRTEMLRIRVSIEEKALFEKFFESHNVTLSDGIRQSILRLIDIERNEKENR